MHTCDIVLFTLLYNEINIHALSCLLEEGPHEISGREELPHPVRRGERGRGRKREERREREINSRYRYMYRWKESVML